MPDADGPAPPTPAGLLLAPGAGAGSDQPALVAVDRAVTAAGLVVARMDFPYRLAGRRAPDRPPVLLAAVVQAATALAEAAGTTTGRLALGGRSMGGRMCSMAVADGLPAAALVLISYPLHPPGRPDRLRTDHFGALDLPCLFVSGTRDAFGTPAELEQATATIPGPVTHVWIDGGDHGLRGKDRQVADAVLRWLCP
ncbi:MAG TPA: alpha/beta family hydrolase [Acidimicrobiales bacterium]|nr:alpha/beta family hydrolase [Acidimicrobiales bacterium]